MFFLMPRTIVVLAIVFGLILAKRLYRQWRARIENDHRPVPQLPGRLLGDGERTWVVFTTPMCASCGPVTDRLRQLDPLAEVVTVDATKQVALADDFRVKAAPTVLLADRDGNVQARLVGAGAVDQILQYVG